MRSDGFSANEGEFWALWLRDRALLLRMCTRWLGGHRQDAEDVLSHGALRALRFLREHPLEAATFRSWALRLLRNLCIDRLRAGGRELLRFVDVDADESPEPSRARAYAPDRLLLLRELGATLDTAVASLPQRLRATFDLRVHEDRSYDQISQELSITPANARKRVQQAREHLRERLVAQGFSE